MKRRNNFFITTILVVLTSTLCAADFKSGEEVNIDQPVSDNLYLAGGTINVNAWVRGDLTAAGGSVSINDTIFEDLIVAGGDIFLNAPLMDDARVAGGDVRILSYVDGDLVLCGGTVRIQKDAVINGDLLVCGGYLILDGTVNGDVSAAGGRISFNGHIRGNVEMRAEELTLNGIIDSNSELAAHDMTVKEGATFRGSVKYWSEDGEVDFGQSLTSGNRAMYTEALEMAEMDWEWGYLGLGFVAFWILNVLSVLLTILLVVLLFRKTFANAGETLNQSFIRNFGYGILYFIGLPVIAVILCLTLIGIPIALVVFHVFGFSLLFSYSLTSVVLAYGVRTKYNKEWSKWRLMLVAVVIFIALKLISAVPFIGPFVAAVVIATAFGALIVPCLSLRVRKELE